MELWERLKALAKRNRRTPTEEARIAIEKHLDSSGENFPTLEELLSRFPPDDKHVEQERISTDTEGAPHDK